MTYPVASHFVSLERSSLFYGTSMCLFLFIAYARKGYVCDIKYPVGLFRCQTSEQQEGERISPPTGGIRD